MNSAQAASPLATMWAVVRTWNGNWGCGGVPVRRNGIGWRLDDQNQPVSAPRNALTLRALITSPTLPWTPELVATLLTLLERQDPEAAATEWALAALAHPSVIIRVQRVRNLLVF